MVYEVDFLFYINGFKQRQKYAGKMIQILNSAGFTFRAVTGKMNDIRTPDELAVTIQNSQQIIGTNQNNGYLEKNCKRFQYFKLQQWLYSRLNSENRTGFINEEN